MPLASIEFVSIFIKDSRTIEFVIRNCVILTILPRKQFEFLGPIFVSYFCCVSTSRRKIYPPNKCMNFVILTYRTVSICFQILNEDFPFALIAIGNLCLLCHKQTHRNSVRYNIHGLDWSFQFPMLLKCE